MAGGLALPCTADGCPTAPVRPILRLRPSFEGAGVRRRSICRPGPRWRTSTGCASAPVVGNLLHNALKYTPAGGDVSVRAAVARDRVAITVADSGRGISAEHLPLIFDLFFRGNTGCAGLGVGLTLAHRLAGLHHGTLAAVSDGPGRGSAFTLVLPLVPTARVPLRAPEAGGAGGGGRRAPRPSGPSPGRRRSCSPP